MKGIDNILKKPEMKKPDIQVLPDAEEESMDEEDEEDEED